MANKAFFLSRAPFRSSLLEPMSTKGCSIKSFKVSICADFGIYRLSSVGNISRLDCREVKLRLFGFQFERLLTERRWLLFRIFAGKLRWSDLRGYGYLRCMGGYNACQFQSP